MGSLNSQLGAQSFTCPCEENNSLLFRMFGICQENLLVYLGLTSLQKWPVIPAVGRADRAIAPTLR